MAPDDLPRTGKVVAGLVVALLLVNLPLGHHLWQEWRLDRDGRDVVAEVSATDVLKEETDPHYVVRFRLPEDVDPEERVWPADVTRASWQRAEDSGEIRVRVLPGRPGTQEVEGARASALGLIVVGVVDGVLLLVAAMLWRHHRRRVHDAPGSDAGPDTLQA
ncbi:DUF3592 domain-containing protein [Nocardioides caeni]|uniref:DUF3592 domain-containing protein n=1 Tax=Nocardioides caeni TaxID=574700 RepID=A0A4S8N6H2_9ACTN|nr:DUF3592 domain-containing protein [Nocardioides caeni]THV10499.1 hypothetical protein E9934_14330 [Nocardioides caeni]